MQILNNKSSLAPEFWYEHELKFASSTKILKEQDADYTYFYHAAESTQRPLLAINSTSCGTIKKNYRAAITMPEYLTIKLITAGSMIAKYSGQIYLIEKNDLVIFLPGVSFEYKSGPENFCKSINLLIAGNALNACLSVSRLSGSPVIPLSESQARKIAVLIGKARLFFKDTLPYKTDTVAGFCMEVIQRLESEIISGEVPQKEPLAQILHTLSAEMDKKLTIKTIASRFGLSSCGLIRLFRQKMHKSFHEYLVNIRMEKAKFLLAQGKISVKEVALITGFSSQENFSTAFRSYCGLPPGEFSKKYCGKQIVSGSLKTL